MAFSRGTVAGPQFLRFIVVGVLSTVVNYTVFLALFIAGTPYLLAMIAGFLVGTIAGFRINKSWTYGVDHEERGHFPKYLAVYIFSLLAGIGFLLALVEIVGFDPRVGNILTIGLTTCTNFVGTKFLVFKK